MPNSLESLIATVKQHEDKHKEHKNEFSAQAERIRKVEEAQLRFEKGQDALFNWKAGMEEWKRDSDTNYRDLKDTITTENRQTQNLLMSLLDKQWKLIEAKNNATEADKVRQHEIVKTEQEIKKETRQKFWEFVGKIFATGGVGAAVILGIMSLFGITL